MSEAEKKSFEQTAELIRQMTPVEQLQMLAYGEGLIANATACTSLPPASPPPSSEGGT